MTDATPEPSLTDILAAINAVARTQAEHGAAIEGLRLDFAARAELDESRHTEVTQYLEGIAGLVHDQQHALAQGEARLTSRIGDVQSVVQAVKADLAAHSSDTQIHRDTHGQAA